MGLQQQAQRYLLVVLDLILQDDAVGLVWLLPQQGDAVLACALLMDDHHLGRGWGRRAQGVTYLLVGVLPGWGQQDTAAWKGGTGAPCRTPVKTVVLF